MAADTAGEFMTNENQKEARRLAVAAARQALPPGVGLLRTLPGHEGTITCIAFDPQGETLASASEDRTVKLWKVSSGGLLRTLGKQRNNSYNAPFSVANVMFADRNDFLTLLAHRNTILSVAFDPQGLRLASGTADKTISLWNARSGTCLRLLVSPQDMVWSVAFNPQGGTLASGNDKTVKLWEVRTGKLLRALEGHLSFVMSVAFDPHGETLASGSDDTTVKL